MYKTWPKLRPANQTSNPRPVIANIDIGQFIIVSVKNYISSSFHCHLVGDLPFVRVAPDPQQPSGLGRRGLSRGACGLLGNIAFDDPALPLCRQYGSDSCDTVGKARGAPD